MWMERVELVPGTQEALGELGERLREPRQFQRVHPAGAGLVWRPQGAQGLLFGGHSRERREAAPAMPASPGP